MLPVQLGAGLPRESTEPSARREASGFDRVWDAMARERRDPEPARDEHPRDDGTAGAEGALAAAPQRLDDPLGDGPSAAPPRHEPAGRVEHARSRVFRSAPPRSLPPPEPGRAGPSSGWTPLVPDRRESASGESTDPRGFTPLAPSRSAGPPRPRAPVSLPPLPPLDSELGEVDLPELPPELAAAVLDRSDLASAGRSPSAVAPPISVDRDPGPSDDEGTVESAAQSTDSGTAPALDRRLFGAVAARVRAGSGPLRLLRALHLGGHAEGAAHERQTHRPPAAEAPADGARAEAPTIEPAPSAAPEPSPTSAATAPPGEPHHADPVEHDVFREAARPGLPPSTPDEPLPPPILREHVRVRIDPELQLDVVTRGQKVDVTLTGPAPAVDPLRTLGPELDASLVASGFALGQFSAQGESAAHDHGEPPGDPGGAEKTPAPKAAAPARKGPWRLNRYA